MKSYFIKTPHLIPFVFRNQIWNFSKKERVIYLTFDDGPTPKVTDWVLEILQQYHAKATFFCIGKNIAKHPSIFKKIFDQGHGIGNHTYTHLNGWKTSNKKYQDSIFETQKIIQTLVPQTTNLLFRPPYGKIKLSQTKQLLKNKYQVIMWSVLSGDFDTTINANKCLNNVLENTNNGSIIVFHDSVKAFEKLQVILPQILIHYSQKGYLFKAI